MVTWPTSRCTPLEVQRGNLGYGPRMCVEQIQSPRKIKLCLVNAKMSIWWVFYTHGIKNILCISISQPASEHEFIYLSSFSFKVFLHTALKRREATCGKEHSQAPSHFEAMTQKLSKRSCKQATSFSSTVFPTFIFLFLVFPEKSQNKRRTLAVRFDARVWLSPVLCGHSAGAEVGASALLSSSLVPAPLTSRQIISCLAGVASCWDAADADTRFATSSGGRNDREIQGEQTTWH